ncbi:MAG: hypothetical protein RLZZ562_2495 [Planctomycetota bacterium]
MRAFPSRSFPPSRCLHSLLLAIAAVTLSIAPAAAQSDSILCDTPRELRCEPMELDAFVARCEAQLDGRHEATLAHGTPRQLAGATLGWLRLGRADRALATLEALAQRAAEGDHDANAWWLIARFWMSRAMSLPSEAIDETRRVVDAARSLATECARTDNPPSLTRHVLCVHAIACASELLSEKHDAKARDELIAAARRSLLRFEEIHWSEPHAAFVDHTLRPSADGLLACAIGMLAATGNRAERNARSCLASLPADCASQVALAARAQFGFEVDATLAQLLANAPHADDDETGWTLDAAMFAITGLRLATGPRVDAAWLRLRPVLPQGFDRMRIRGLALDGWRCELEFARTRGDASAIGRYTLTPIESRATWRQLVVHHGAETFVAPALAGVEVELPPRSKERELSSPSTR